ncbi:MAG: T9SS type A sorting domain-containing protein [Bacteroidia bacterium]|nr:T9SS type A sorting domain-containing protein [Bacteroidia bacterium]
MKKLLLPLALVCGIFTDSLKAQLTITDSLDFAQISTLLQGFGTNISNTVYNCNTRAVAQFSGTSELPNTNGLLLSTGLADSVANLSTNLASWVYNTAPFPDPDMQSLSAYSTYDGCILEFDCIPLGDTLLFNYTFGSEEYPEYVNNGYNDAFGIFLTGPGYANVNIATIPGTSLPVTINNVNASTNSSFYHDNSAGQLCAFDGFSLSLTSTTAVTPNQTYHFKIGVADASDMIYDTGVFLEAFSFRSNMSIGINTANENSISLIKDPQSSNVILRFRNPASEKQNFEVYDLNGKKVFSTNLNSGSLSQTINIGELQSGIYFARVLTNGQQVFSKKIVVTE